MVPPRRRAVVGRQSNSCQTQIYSAFAQLNGRPKRAVLLLTLDRIVGLSLLIDGYVRAMRDG